MNRNLLVLLFFFIGITASQAQTADEIIANYFENTGGLAKWKALESVKMNAKINQGGLEIPLIITQLKDGRQMTSITFQGKEIKQGVYDGTTLWNTNFMTMKAEKSDAETLEIFVRDDLCSDLLQPKTWAPKHWGQTNLDLKRGDDWSPLDHCGNRKN